MAAQSYKNHLRLHPPFHFIAMPLLLLGVLLAVANFVMSMVYFRGYRGVMVTASIAMIAVALQIIAIFARMYPIKIQDRVIALEVALRFERLAGGKSFSTYEGELSNGQIVALRFASDAELVPLVQIAAEKNLSPKEIKQSIKEWRPDNRRV